MHKRARAGLGYLPQEASVFRRLSVRDNLMAVLELRNELSKAERVAKANQLLAEFHLNHVADSPGGPFQGASADGLNCPRTGHGPGVCLARRTLCRR